MGLLLPAGGDTELHLSCVAEYQNIGTSSDPDHGAASQESLRSNIPVIGGGGGLIGEPASGEVVRPTGGSVGGLASGARGLASGPLGGPASGAGGLDSGSLGGLRNGPIGRWYVGPVGDLTSGPVERLAGGLVRELAGGPVVRPAGGPVGGKAGGPSGGLAREPVEEIMDCGPDYIELLQHEVNRNPDRPLEAVMEEESEEASPCRMLPAACFFPQKTVVSPCLGGTPVTPELMENLKMILFGGTFRAFNYEWRKSCFQFRETNSEMSYALEADRGGAQAIQMVIQALVIRDLLFGPQGVTNRRTLQSLQDVGQEHQDQALAVALSDSLWLAGEGERATVTMVTEDYCSTPHLDYKLHNFTEKLQLFVFERKDDTRRFILDHIHCFKEEGGHGVILFLYSLICSRTLDRIRDDLDSTTSHLLHLSLGNFVCHQALLNLLLTGRASPQVFNGTLRCSEDGQVLERPLQGVASRSDVGYLYWNREQMDRGLMPQVGSMLKTPRFPVWVCCINGTYSVLFSLTRSLLSDWKVEHQFQLFYYNGQSSSRTTTRLIVDTHSHHWEAPSSDPEADPEKRFPSLEMTIRTKWAGASIDWTGTDPFY